jgi:hypothetical protein
MRPLHFEMLRPVAATAPSLERDCSNQRDRRLRHRPTTTQRNRTTPNLGAESFRVQTRCRHPPAKARSHTGNQNDGGPMLGPEQQIE